MNQSQLARETGLSASAINDMIKGRRRPYMDEGAAIARALDVDLDELLFDAEHHPSTATVDGFWTDGDLPVLKFAMMVGAQIYGDFEQAIVWQKEQARLGYTVHYRNPRAIHSRWPDVPQDEEAQQDPDRDTEGGDS